MLDLNDKKKPFTTLTFSLEICKVYALPQKKIGWKGKRRSK